MVGLKDAQRASKTLFICVSVRVFLEEIRSWMVEPSKAGGPPHCGWPSSYPFEPLNRTKRQISAFLALKLSDSDLDLAPSAFISQAFGFRHHQLSSFFTLQRAGWRQFPGSITTWANSYNKCPLISTCILIVLFLWRTLTYPGS